MQINAVDIMKQDYGVIVFILYAIYSEIKRVLSDRKNKVGIHDAKTATIKVRTIEKQAIKRRLKLLELEDDAFYTHLRELNSEQKTEIRSYINGVILSLESDLRDRMQKALLVDDDGKFACPESGDQCYASSKIVGATVDAYLGSLGKIMKQLKDYIWSTILINGFYDLNKAELKQYVEKKATIINHKIRDDMHDTMPKGLALQYNRESVSIQESIKYFGSLIDGIIEIKDRFNEKRSKERNRHREIVEKIYNDEEVIGETI